MMIPSSSYIITFSHDLLFTRRSVNNQGPTALTKMKENPNPALHPLHLLHLIQVAENELNHS